MTGGREGRVAVTMPQLGETVAEGTVLRWLKQVGEAVADQEPLLEISTDKVDAEVPSPAAGVLAEIVVGEDETVDVGTVLAHVAPGAPSPGQRAEATGAPPVEPAAEERSPSPPSGERSSPPAGGPRHRHSPRVRRLAHDSGVDLASLTGTGPAGRVTPDDVERAARHAAPEPVPSPEVPVSVPNRAASQRVSSAAATEPLPSLARSSAPAANRAFRTLVAEVDVPAAQWVGSSDQASVPVPGSAAAAVVAAVAGALRSHPSLLPPGAGADAGDLAVSWSTGSGTTSCLLSQAGELNVGGVAQRLLAGATAGEPPPGAGFTVSLLQDTDVLFEVAEPPPGQVAAIVFGTPTRRVVVVDADGSPGIAVRQRSSVALSHDPGTVSREVALAFLRDVVRRAHSRA
ncbi:hypothetical protein ASD62_16160 [Phycicoccus sp. Root563]|uniref:biotin/lipoyl-containing protein n=1 Tax=Phycicoccus sp. Root563 TaxID=1736562 RepID=UPI0007034F59|nr:biotin/lipoyl-containing protein [Phycicoccus sp. Root563]KQZ90590.1 hypothetical protein ASD62_16160 [Phycicoccus sp. Root563]